MNYIIKLVVDNVLVRPCIAHYKTILHNLNPITKTKKYKLKKGQKRPTILKDNLNKHFVYDLFLFLSICCFGIFGLHFESTGKWITSYSQLKSSPYLFVHQILPTRIWLQSDMCLLIDIVSVLVILVTFTLLPPLSDHDRFTFDHFKKRYVINGQVLSEENSAKVETLSLKADLILPYTFSLALFYTIFCLITVYLNKHFNVSFFSFIFWFILYPIFMFYLIFGKLRRRLKLLFCAKF